MARAIQKFKLNGKKNQAMENEKTTFETRTSKISLIEDCIVFIEEKAGIEILYEDAVKNAKLINETYIQKKLCILVDLRTLKSISKEARDYNVHSDTYPKCLAVGILIDSFFSRVIANFFIGFSKPIIPIKLFTSKKEAVDWLKIQYMK